MRSFTARQKTNGLFITAIGLIGLLTLINLAHFSRLRNSTQDFIRTQNTLRGLANLFSAVQDAETGQRGYLLTGNATYLRPFQEGRIAFGRFFDYLQHLTINDSDDQATLARLNILIREKFNELELTIHLRRHNDLAQIKPIMVSNIGRDLMDEIRFEINHMEEHEEQILKKNQRALNAQTAQRMWLLFVGTIVSVGLLAWMFYLLTHEIKARRQSQEALQATQKQLEAQTTDLLASNKELEAFCYSVSHDLRAPLCGIGGFSQLVSEKYHAALDEEGRGYLERVRKGIQRMSQLIDDLLDLSRITRTAMTIKPVDLAAMTREIAEDLKDPQSVRNVEWIVPPSLMAPGDPHLLRTVFENLLENALKFTSKRDAARIEIGQDIRPEGPVYFVRDNGAGFDMVYQDKLFHAFQRLHTHAEFAGTGIGLAIVQRVIQRHSGRIWAESKVNEGATFFFTLRRSYVD